MDLPSQLRAAILAQSLPPPSTALLTALTTSRSPPPPLPSLVATAKARLLAADLTSPAHFALNDDPTSSSTSASVSALPPRADDATAKEIRLSRPVHVQVLDIENLSLSRWEQVEELEAVERGEMTRGREVVRVTAEDDDNNNNPSTATDTQPTNRTTSTFTTAANTAVRRAGKTATHRLILQDCRGKKVYAVELRRVDGVGVGTTQAGEKMLLKAGTVIARGTVLLEPERCVVLGGRVEAWQKAWVKGRLARLREAAGRQAGE